KITIDHTKVADVAEPSTTYANFPVYVHAAGLSNINANGADIRFTASDGITELSREIEKYDSGTLDAWVKVSLTKDAGDSSDDVIYMYYGNVSAAEPAPGSAYGRENVWASNNYIGVWHLEEEQAGTGALNLYKDATSTNKDGDDYVSATGQDGQIAGGQQFDNSDWIRVPEMDSLATGNPVFTINAWIKLADSGANYIMSENTGPYNKEWMAYTSGLNVVFCHISGTEYYFKTTTTSPLIVGNWHMVTFKVSRTSGYVYIYVDGINQAMDSNTVSSVWGSRPAPFYIGKDRGGYFNGFMDEIRVSNIARSAGWIATEYNNQNSPAAFYIIGGEDSSADESITLSLSHIKNPTVIGSTGVYQIKTTDASDADIDEDTNVSADTIISDAAAYLEITSPADITAGERAAYTITRYDQYDNLGNNGIETVYLYTSSTGVNARFYDAETNGNVITNISFGDGESTANSWYYDELMGAYTISVSDNASSPDGNEGVNDITDALNVLHASEDHLAFSEDITSPKTAGTQFTLPQILAKDIYGNTLTNDYGATPYSGTKTISYALSGDSDAPDGNATDSWTTTVDFSNGGSTTALATTLYRGQDTTITASVADLSGTNTASNLVTVDPELAVKLAFYQEPSLTGTVNVALAQQPILQIRDTYGNRTDDIYNIRLWDSSTTGTYPSDYSDAVGDLDSSHANNTLPAVAGVAEFDGVRYNALGQIYVYADCPEESAILPAFSTAVNFYFAGTSLVTAADSAVSDFNLTPTNDEIAEKFEALKFKVHDVGADITPTLIDQIQLTVQGTGLSASTDIAWAGLYVGEALIDTAAGDDITDSL
ncbi:MAG: DUF2341 domain-containing protein, partial [Candidatus Pacebacteria bacterium]|nr:DUF2341 domain-containing protein [Candidatus Paceibacterota bacterium]